MRIKKDNLGFSITSLKVDSRNEDSLLFLHSIKSDLYRITDIEIELREIFPMSDLFEYGGNKYVENYIVSDLSNEQLLSILLCRLIERKIE